MKKTDLENTGDVKKLVDSFYDKVKVDTLLSPIFFEKIPGDWQIHMNKMYAFWNAALFGIPGYKGAPFMPHATMKIDATHFNQWLHLFAETIHEHFEGPVANDALHRAALMAKMFLKRIEEYKVNPNQVPLA